MGLDNYVSLHDRHYMCRFSSASDNYLCLLNAQLDSLSKEKDWLDAHVLQHIGVLHKNVLDFMKALLVVTHSLILY